MSRFFKDKNILLCGILPNIGINEVDFNKYKEARGLYIEDPWERVKSIFSKDDMGNLHPELKYAIDMTQIGIFIGGMYGGSIESYKRAESFIRTNDANIYATKSHVYKILSNESMKAFIRGATRWAPKFAVFCGGFALISSCCEAYRNKPSVIDCGIAGLSVGALCRFLYGIKGMLSGAIVGGALGTSYGLMKWIRYQMTDKENLEIKYAHFAFARYREQLKKGISQPKTETETESETGTKTQKRQRLSTLDDFVVEDETPETKPK